MKNFTFFILLFLAIFLAALPANVVHGKNNQYLYVDDDHKDDDDDSGCDGMKPCFAHPQDAVNVANPGDTILVYPGTYGSRRFQTMPPHFSENDQYAPALIVYKDGLTIRAVNENPEETTIESTHRWWSNIVAVQASTGGEWDGDGKQYVGAGVNPSRGIAPNAVSIIANDVTIEGFTIRRPLASTTCNNVNLLIGGLFEGYGTRSGETIGFSGNTIKNNIFYGGDAVTIWHASGNEVLENTAVDACRAAFRVWDGWTQGTVSLQPPSKKNKIYSNKIVDDPQTPGNGQAIFVGAWYDGTPNDTWTDNTGTEVIENDCGGLFLFTAYSSGIKKFLDNKNVSDFRFYQATGFKVRGNLPPAAGEALRATESLATRLSRNKNPVAEYIPSDMNDIPYGPPADQIVDGF